MRRFIPRRTPILAATAWIATVAASSAASRPSITPGRTPSRPSATASPLATAPVAGLTGEGADGPAGGLGATAPAGDGSAIAGEVAILRNQLQALSSGETPPTWATNQARDLRQILDRVVETQERLSARIETPLPRLDEPLILFTVAASTFVLGFFLGSRAQRRRSRRDGRLRI